MPSNRELKREAEALGEELGVSVDTAGLNNAKLVDLVSELKAKRGDAPVESHEPEQPRVSSLTRAASRPAEPEPFEEPEPSAPEPQTEPDPPAPEPVNGAPEMGGPPDPKPAAPALKYPYTVAQGKACTSLRGILGPGQQANPEYFSGGQRTLDQLVDKGIVIKR